MEILKSTKQTKKTFTMTFEFENSDGLKRLKALSILLGNYNPLRKEMKSPEEVYAILQVYRNEGYVIDMINEISKQLI